MLTHLLRRLASTTTSSPPVAATAINTASTTPFSAATITSPTYRAQCLQRLQETSPLRTGTGDPAKRSAAVLVPLCQDADGQLHLLYTLRSATISSHSGQVSFPGGMRDETDASLEACALREAQEEIGLSAGQIEIWGRCPTIPAYKAPAVTPILAVVHDFRHSELRLNAAEVAEAFTIPLQTLCDPRLRRHTQFRMGSAKRAEAAALVARGYSLPVFVGGAHPVWGITAMITHMVLQALLPQPEIYGRRKVPFVSRRK